MTAPTAEDVIAEALSLAEGTTPGTDPWHATAAAAVVAAIRGMTVEQQAELIGGTVAAPCTRVRSVDGVLQFRHHIAVPWRRRDPS